MYKKEVKRLLSPSFAGKVGVFIARVKRLSHCKTAKCSPKKKMVNVYLPNTKTT
jgi:hypothetical protein